MHSVKSKHKGNTKKARVQNFLRAACETVDRELLSGSVCQFDTDGDGNCGRPLCPCCGAELLAGLSGGTLNESAGV